MSFLATRPPGIVPPRGVDAVQGGAGPQRGEPEYGLVHPQRLLDAGESRRPAVEVEGNEARDRMVPARRAGGRVPRPMPVRQAAHAVVLAAAHDASVRHHRLRAAPKQLRERRRGRARGRGDDLVIERHQAERASYRFEKRRRRQPSQPALLATILRRDAENRRGEHFNLTLVDRSTRRSWRPATRCRWTRNLRTRSSASIRCFACSACGSRPARRRGATAATSTPSRATSARRGSASTAAAPRPNPPPGPPRRSRLRTRRRPKTASSPTSARRR
mmetsp:Transcript_11341/g.34912  ORF Transcript_11341/g.34912 Transcript_11341/m.34912 type:complete len:275 (-) Transcript_11341:287-1111(-)